MKSNKGIAMLSLVIYVASFLVITTLVGTISTYFYNNINLINSTVGGSSEYTKLNLYLINLTKGANLVDIDTLNIDPYSGDPAKANTDVYSTVVFTYNDNVEERRVAITRQGSYLYYCEKNVTNNEITEKFLLCSDVAYFSTNVNVIDGKEILMVNIKLSGSNFTTKYVIGRVD